MIAIECEGKMPGYNCPDNVSASDPEAPWNKEEIDDTYRFRDFYIPPRMMVPIERYVNQGIPPGDFLTAVICNDLAEAVGRADEENMANLPAYVSYFYNEVDRDCWGSKEKKAAWVGKFCGKCVTCDELTRNLGIELGKKVFMCQRCKEREQP